MNDKIILGALAGTIGAFLQDLCGYIAEIIGFSDRGFIDFARAVILFNIKSGALETFLASIAHIIWDLLLGILFAYLIKNTSDSFYYLKALIYGLVLWFMIHTAGTLFRLPLFFRIPASAAMATLLGAIVYSLGIAFIIKFLEKRPN
ncbi:MAG TPA: hypothetical protein DDW50_10470 [Firmicutes bacterium]|nr:hypothetical protein [Bacillota bacterium]